jgi:hypothetical protein
MRRGIRRLVQVGRTGHSAVQNPRLGQTGMLAGINYVILLSI